MRKFLLLIFIIYGCGGINSIQVSDEIKSRVMPFSYQVSVNRCIEFIKDQGLLIDRIDRDNGIIESSYKDLSNSWIAEREKYLFNVTDLNERSRITINYFFERKTSDWSLVRQDENELIEKYNKIFEWIGN